MRITIIKINDIGRNFKERFISNFSETIKLESIYYTMLLQQQRNPEK